MKYYRAEFGGIEPWMWFNNGDLAAQHGQWTQQPDHWTLFFLEHTGGFILNNRVEEFHDGYVALVAPGTKAGFLRTGDGTPHYSLTFGLTKRLEVVALPSLTDLGDLKEVRRKEFEQARDWLSRSIGRSIAAVHNLLWSIAEPAHVLRSSANLYQFERLVMDKLAEKVSVASFAAEMGISQSQLLRIVRAEYGQTVQAFVREKRTEIARTLITTTDSPLKTIAAQTGMPDLQYFNKAVRNSSGLSPRALRDLAQNRTRH